MLNMNKYVVTNLFKFGLHFEFGSFALNRYQNGQFRGKLSFLSLTSSGTGHWPFAVFDLNFITGFQSAWQLMVCGITVGSRKVHSLNEDGSIAGPDKSKLYLFLSCLNHRNQTMEEIINAD